MGWDWTLDKDLLVQIDMILVHPAQHITGAVLHSVSFGVRLHALSEEEV